MLTSKQKELLLFINERIQETGVSPSFDEMKDALNLASKSGIHRLITALEERGFIRRLAHRARALEVLKLPDAVAPGAPRGRKEFKPALVASGQPNWISTFVQAHLDEGFTTPPTAFDIYMTALYWSVRKGHEGVMDILIQDCEVSRGCVRRLGMSRPEGMRLTQVWRTIG